jgi:YVTN family beta-propeller protein
MVVSAATCFGEAIRNTNPQPVILAPALTQYCRVDPDGVSVIPNGRLLTPRGKQILIEPHPYGLAVSSDDKTVVTVNSGTRPFSFSIIRNPFSDTHEVYRIPEGVTTDEGVLNACFMGVALVRTADRQLLYASGGDDGTVMVWDLDDRVRLHTIDLNVPFRGRGWHDSYTGDLVLSPDGSRIHVLDQMNFRLVSIATASNEIVDVVPVGRYPFGICCTPDGSKVYVANVGLFEYSAVKGFDPKRFNETALKFPAFAYLSDEMIHGTYTEGKWVPGLGHPNVPESVSVFSIDLQARDQGKVVAKIKTGVLVGERVEDIPAVGGSSPNSVATDGRFVYVSNGTNDSISVIDVSSDTLADEIQIRLPAPLDVLRGVIPFGLALSPDGRRLYVAESGINAVGVIDTRTRRVIGHIPAGWFPSKLAVTQDGEHLIVANAKGFGAGPNGGPNVDTSERGFNIGSLMRGTLSLLKIPRESELGAETAQVLSNNALVGFSRPWDGEARNPIPPYPGAYRSPIRHVVFITKENRTYDQVYGELEGGRGEPSLADFGLSRTVRSVDRPAEMVESVNVMPNHQVLARRFSTSDNFYCDSDHSADGHRWLVGVYPGTWAETSTSASYGGRRNHKTLSTAPGRRGVSGASGAIYPEDYLEAGSIWEHYERNGISFFNFGLGFEFAGSMETAAYKYTGVRIPINYPMPAPLFDRTSRIYPTYNTNIPDQFRVQMFEKELQDRWLSGKEPFPTVITMMLPNDHGDKEKPHAGYPFYESYMADNDLALGRVVELLSHTKYWREMAIIVTEDDAQNGRDHIDSHRSICLVISPYARAGHISHVHTSIASIIKTINLIVGAPYLNQYDAAASDLSDLFQSEPDFSPYDAVPVHPGVFDPAEALDPMDAQFDWKSVNEFPVLDHPSDMREWMRRDAEDRLQKLKESEADAIRSDLHIP